MVYVVGHRGAAGLEPENTLRSIRRAIDLGVDHVEVDVHTTKDGHVVVIHDETVDRTTDGHGYVSDLTLEQIKKLDAGKGEQIPTLQEAIDAVRGKTGLYVELKADSTAEAVLKIIEQNRFNDETFIITFDSDLLKFVKQANPHLKTGMLFLNPPRDVCDRTIELRANGFCIDSHYVTPEIVETAHKNGLVIGVWSPDTEEEMRQVVDLDIDIISTNRPDILLRLLGRAKSLL